MSNLSESILDDIILGIIKENEGIRRGRVCMLVETKMPEKFPRLRNESPYDPIVQKTFTAMATIESVYQAIDRLIAEGRATRRTTDKERIFSV